MNKSKIAWTDYTWNVTSGCTRISRGCDNCYAERMSVRLKSMGARGYEHGFAVTLHSERMYEPIMAKRPRKIFVVSMGDLLHPDVPLEFILKVFETCRQAPQHTFQFLTKRPERLRDIQASFDFDDTWPKNAWIGVSIEGNETAHRADTLRLVAAHRRWVSFEPLIGPVDAVSISGMDWIVIGGESGAGARPMCQEWVTDLMGRSHGIPVFFKQWGEWRDGKLVGVKKAGFDILGEVHQEYPQP